MSAQDSKFARGEAIEMVRTEMRAVEFGYSEAERRESAADLTIATFVHGDAPGGIVTVFDALELKPAAPILEHDTVVADDLARECR